ncbi:MAG: DUF2971 domain-containing protein [Deltaproteobacteria bacterium]|nr:DUF2971 domain-containing protein [Deltaproteobacteria bacterium]
MLHGKPHFFKYCTSDTLEKVLTNRTFKWSSPTLFNDPFDIQTDFRFGFEVDDFQEPLIQEQIEIVWGDNEPKGNINHPIFKAMLEARKTRIMNPGFRTRAEYEKFFRKIYPKYKKEEENLRELKRWWKKLSEGLRVYCVSEVHDDPLLWAHYADQHSGAVIKHKVIPKKYAICAAMPVRYDDQIPMIADIDTYIKHITGQQELDVKEIFINFTTTKSNHWAYEKEWRCLGPAQNSKELFDLRNFAPEEIEAIYFGCRMREDVRTNIIKLLTPDFSHVKLFQARTHPKKYKLDFDSIGS